MGDLIPRAASVQIPDSLPEEKPKIKSNSSSKVKAAPGELTEKITQFLEKAGPKGSTFKKIGRAVGLSRTRISGWYYCYGIKHDVVVKTGKAQIVLRSLFTKAADSNSKTEPKIKAKIDAVPKEKNEKTLTERIVDYLSGFPGAGLHYHEIALAVSSSTSAMSTWYSTYGKKCPNVRKSSPGILTYVKTTHNASRPTIAPEEIASNAAAFLKVFGTGGANKNEIGNALGMKGKAFVKWFYSPMGRSQTSVIKIGPSMFAYKAPVEG